MRMESVYLETTFISYLVARASRDVIVAGHQQTTQDWWANRRGQFECSAGWHALSRRRAWEGPIPLKRIGRAIDIY